jgi:hypothetical protein
MGSQKAGPSAGNSEVLANAPQKATWLARCARGSSTKTSADDAVASEASEAALASSSETEAGGTGEGTAGRRATTSNK